MSNKKLLALAAVVAASAASAQTTQATHAGTLIRNVATLTYDDPNTGTKVPPITSNEVVTKVAAVPNFTITPNQTAGDTGVANQDAPGQEQGNVTPGAEIEFVYDVTNTGNTPIIVELDPKSANADRSDNKVDPAKGITYFANGVELKDTDGDGKVEVPQLAVGETIKITQKYTVPAGATENQQYGANPVGTATYNKDKPEEGTAVLPNGDNVEIIGQPGTPLIDQNNFNRVTVIKTGITHTPPTNPVNPEDPGNTTPPPSTPTNPKPGEVTPPPPPGNPGLDPTPTPDTGKPDKPVEPNNPPGENNNPSTPGYKDPNPNDPNNPTPIATNPNGKDQVAYPPADTNTTPDKVTFVNVVTNTGGTDDQITIGDPTVEGTPPGTTAEIKEPKKDGQPITDEDPQKPGIQVTLKPGESVTYRTEVTYPDKDDSTTPRDPIVVKVPVTSQFDPPNEPPLEITDTIYPPATLFGDTLDENKQPNVNGLEVTPTPKPVQTVDPSKAPSTAPLTSPDNTDSTATFPMTVTNPGAYNDTYILEGTVDFGQGPVPVKYFDSTGKELPKVPGTNTYITPVVEAGQKLEVYAVVDVPAGTAPNDYTVNQKLKANYSGIQLEDTNDIIRVQAAGDAKVAKFQNSVDNTTGPDAANGIKSPTGFTPLEQERKPNEPYKYRIVAQNDYNAPVANAEICDVTPQKVNFSKVAVINYTGAATSATEEGNPLAGYANNEGNIVAAQSEGKKYCVIIPEIPANSSVTVEFDAVIK